jgi:hypothetical protein
VNRAAPHGRFRAFAGRSNVSMSSRYVHPSEDSVLNAMSNLAGHNIGHGAKEAQLSAADQMWVPEILSHQFRKF